MKVLRIVASISFLIVRAVTGKTYKVIAGRTGVGKTYLLTLAGCPGEDCSGLNSCVEKIHVCSHGYIDTVGLDSAKGNRKYTVIFEGSIVPISGLAYPVYALFDILEKEKINDVEFYFVYDATNNIRMDDSSQYFMSFLTKDLQCSYTRVINKFREQLRPRLKNVLLPGDIFVYEDATTLALNGKNCVFGLAPDWRQKVLASDLTHIRSRINVETCDILLARKSQYNEALGKKSQEINLLDCTENVEKRVNKECARRDDVHIAVIEANNQCLHEERAGLTAFIREIDAGLVECKNVLPSWHFEYL